MIALALAALLAAEPALAAPLAPPAVPPPPATPSAAARARPAASEDGPERLLGEWPAKPSGKTVTLAEKMDLDEALEHIAEAAGWSLVANTGRDGDRVLILSLRGVPVEQALRAVLDGTPLAAIRRGDTVTVAPRPLARVEVPVLAGFDKPSGKRVTADLTDVPVDKALRRIADAAGLSLVLPPGLRGAVTAHFKDTPVEEALKAILVQAGLSASREGSIVTVSRESGPRVVIRGGKRSFVFPGGEVEMPAPDEGREVADEARQAAEEARQAAEEAAQDAREKTAGGRRHGRGLDRVKGGDVTVAPGERLRDVVSIRGSVRLGPGASAREVTAVIGSVDLEPGATVEREVVAIGGNVHVSPGAHVGKDAVSIGGDVVIDPGGMVEGEQTAVSIPGLGSLLSLVGGAGHEARRISPLLRVGRVLAEYVVFFALGLLVLVFAPRRLESVSSALGGAPLKVLVAGLLGTVALPVLGILLVATVIGIPLVAVEVLAILLAGMLGFTALALLIGRGLPLSLDRGAAVIQLAIGTAIVVAVSRIPLVGALAWVTAWLFVFGAVLRTRFGQPPSEAALPTTPLPPPSPPSAG
jgi:hypothetical protein